MPLRSLPHRPSLEHLRNEARELQRRLRDGDPQALALAREFHPRLFERAERFGLSDAQLTVARSYGYASWPKLKAYVEAITAYTRNPGRVRPQAEPAEEFLRLACLTYGGDDLSRPARAGQTSGRRSMAVTDPYRGRSVMREPRSGMLRADRPIRDHRRTTPKPPTVSPRTCSIASSFTAAVPIVKGSGRARLHRDQRQVQGHDHPGGDRPPAQQPQLQPEPEGDARSPACRGREAREPCRSSEVRETWACGSQSAPPTPETDAPSVGLLDHTQPRAPHQPWPALIVLSRRDRRLLAPGCCGRPDEQRQQRSLA